MRLTTYLTKAFRDRVVLAAVERSCSIRHILEQAVASYVAQQNLDSLPPVIRKDFPEDKVFRSRIRNCVKITTIISDETRAALERLKQMRGYSISHSLDRAIHWYLWESPEKMKPRRSFEEAFCPRLDIPVKAKVALPPELPDLRAIKPGSPVLIDSSVIFLAMDSRRLGYASSRSTQCENLLFDAKNGVIRGFITPFIVEDLWTTLSYGLQHKDTGSAPQGAFPTSASLVNDLCRRLQAFCGTNVENLPVISTDLEKALELARETPIEAKVALSLAAMHRAVGPDFAFATANPESAVAGASPGGVFVPSDLDEIVPMGEEGQWNPRRPMVIPYLKKPVPKWPVVEAGSD
jgi:hypothetical protein